MSSITGSINSKIEYKVGTTVNSQQGFKLYILQLLPHNQHTYIHVAIKELSKQASHGRHWWFHILI